MNNIKKVFSKILPTRAELIRVVHTFTKREWVFFSILLGAFVLSTLMVFYKVNKHFMVDTPAYGGTWTEGVVGTPRFVNPVLALSDADRSLSALVYSGLMRRMPDGTLVPDLASEYAVSADGLTYTFTLRDHLTFHDGKPLTSADVLYTITMAKDDLVKSPKKVNWDGVTVAAPDAHTVTFALRKRYAGFLDTTTIGILPEHLWSKLTPEQFGLSDLNINAVGSGPYAVSSIKNTGSGLPSSYTLRAFNHFALGKPYLQTLVLKFYDDEASAVAGWQSNTVDAVNAVSPESADTLKKSGARLITTTLPRVFGFFVNQSQAPIFTDKHILQAIDMTIDKNKIIAEVLRGYGVPVAGPIPPHVLPVEEISGAVPAPDPEGALAVLAKAGWTKNASGVLIKKTKKSASAPLSFSLSTSDDPELKGAAYLIRDELATIGITVDVKIYDMGSLNQTIIRPRKYDALFFGEVISHEADLYAFWHSSERTDPGLNIAMYTSARADTFLEKAGETLDADARTKLYLSFVNQVVSDAPAVFVYSPDFIYAVRDDINGITLDHITNPSDRFANVYTWYRETDSVWKIFLKKSEK